MRQPLQVGRFQQDTSILLRAVSAFTRGELKRQRRGFVHHVVMPVARWACVTPVMLFAASTNATTDVSCQIGAYRAANGQLLAITRPHPGSPAGFRYTFLDGRNGYTSEEHSPIGCDAGMPVSTTPEGHPASWRRLEFRLTRATFKSKGVQLAGLLMEPNEVLKTPPLIIFVHGSEAFSDIQSYYQYLLTAQGVSTFFYDKRGTGDSSGTYTQSFYVLAEDAANAASEAKRLAAGRYSRIGFFGGSQGGWVAPIAALKTSVDFVEVGFGVIGTPLEQDAWQVDYQLRQFGYGEAVSAKIHEITRVTALVAASNFERHLDELATVRTRYAVEPWFSKIEGQYSGELLRGEIEQARQENPGVPWHYPALKTLKALRIPQLWVFAGADSVAPSAPSIVRLQTLRRTGVHTDIVVFPDTDHGITTFTADSSGRRKTIGLADGYFRLLADWANGPLAPPYGSGQLQSIH